MHKLSKKISVISAPTIHFLDISFLLFWNAEFRLTWIALKSAGAQSGERQTHTVGYRNMDQYKDRINTLMLVSTLITTVTFAAGFTLPGGTNSSNPRQGMAVMLNHIWFKLFIFCITISMYGAISVTLILIWAQLGDITLALLALKVATPLLGVTLATLSGAFLAGVHLVISDLSWLATAFLVLCVIFILMLLLLYTILWFPSSSSNPVVRYISYYPFQFQAWLVEKDETEDM
ncbi:Protein ACCELERATED CELL DEATH 6, partial [Mucuna pruriens]